jgi:hypothetical protein
MVCLYTTWCVLYCSSFCITSRTFERLLTTCGWQLYAFGFPTWRAGPPDQTLGLQAAETVTDSACGTGQSRRQLWVTPGEHPTGPLRSGRPPLHQTLLAS